MYKPLLNVLIIFLYTADGHFHLNIYNSGVLGKLTTAPEKEFSFTSIFFYYNTPEYGYISVFFRYIGKFHVASSTIDCKCRAECVR